MITVQDMERLLFAGGDVVGDDGKKIGSLGQLFLDARTGDPAWVTVTTGLFGKAETFVPMTGAELHGNALHVPYAKDVVKHAPRIESAHGHLSPDEERDLYRHYGLLHDEPADTSRDHDDVPDRDGTAVHETTGVPVAPAPANAFAPLVPTSPGPPPRADHDVVRDDMTTAAAVPAAATAAVPVATADERTDLPVDTAVDTAVDTTTTGSRADEGMVLRAEQARVVGTERVPTERVRMRRYTVTEQKQITVPVQREEFRIEYEPAEDGVLPGASADDTPTPREGVPTVVRETGTDPTRP